MRRSVALASAERTVTTAYLTLPARRSVRNLAFTTPACTAKPVARLAVVRATDTEQPAS